MRPELLGDSWFDPSEGVGSFLRKTRGGKRDVGLLREPREGLDRPGRPGKGAVDGSILRMTGLQLRSGRGSLPAIWRKGVKVDKTHGPKPHPDSWSFVPRSYVSG